MIPTMLALPTNIASTARATGNSFVWLFNSPLKTWQYIGNQRASLADEKAARIEAEAVRVTKPAEIIAEVEIAVEDIPASIEPVNDDEPEPKVVKLVEKSKARNKKASPKKPPLAEAAE